jgi:hypothetical protein
MIGFEVNGNGRWLNGLQVRINGLGLCTKGAQ